MIERKRVFLEKVQENLTSAQSEFISGWYNSCARSCYYAVFQAAIYALGQARVRPRRAEGWWGHDFVQAQFNGELINRRKRYPTSLRATLTQNYALRETADYTTDHVTEVRAARAVGRTEAFVEAIGGSGGQL
jgi:uncharacterized protein (UPF0332 family)